MTHRPFRLQAGFDHRASRPATAHTLRLAGCLTGLALLSACASGPTVSAQQASTQYLSHAGRRYTPPGPASDPWGPYVREAAAKFDVPERWVREVMRQESGGHLYGRGGEPITSGAGAMGLMQVMPATYDEIRGRYPELGSDPYDPHNNILAGTAYIREMYDIYGSPGFLAAYNAGPGRLDDYLTRNRTLPEETRRYVAAIGPRIAGVEPQAPSPGQQYAANASPYSLPSNLSAAPRYSSDAGYSVRTAATTGGARVGRGFIVLNPPAAEAPADAEPMPAANQFAALPAPTQIAALPAPTQTAALPAPTQIAALPAPTPTPFQHQARGPFIVLQPQPAEPLVAQLPEPQRASLPAPVPAPGPGPGPGPGYTAMAFAQIPTPPTPRPMPSTAMAPLPLPLPPVAMPFREAPRTQQQMAVAALVPVSPRSHGIPFISSANAEPIGVHHSGFAPGNWAVQVGAFINEGLAASATTTARDHARDVLLGARSSISPVRQPHGMLYRARLTGLSRDAAGQACERLSRARTTCFIVSPDAQS